MSGRSPSPVPRGHRDESPPLRERSRSRSRSPPPLRPIFVGGFDPYTEVRDLEELFSKYGHVNRVDMKVGYAFVFMGDGAERAVRTLDRTEFGRDYRRLKIEFARGDGSIKRREQQRRDVVNRTPTPTLFVVGFDPFRTREGDLEDFFSKFGRIIRAEIKRNFAFVQFQDVEDATRAFKETNGMKMDDRMLTVEYTQQGGRGGGRPPMRDDYHGRKRSRSRSFSPRRSPPRRRRSRSRSPPPRYRDDRSPPRYRDDRRYSPPRRYSPGRRSPAYDR